MAFKRVAVLVIFRHTQACRFARNYGKAAERPTINTELAGMQDAVGIQLLCWEYWWMVHAVTRVTYDFGELRSIAIVVFLGRLQKVFCALPQWINCCIVLYLIS